MNAEKYYEENFETRAIHCGQDASQWNCRAVVPPVVLATTYQQTGPDVDSVCFFFFGYKFYVLIYHHYFYY